MPGAEFYSDLLVYMYLITFGFVTFMLSFVWGFAKFVLPRWLEEEAARAKKTEVARAAKPTPMTTLLQAA
ncbi:MAG: hypothetical protein F9K13_04675 [Candidatus Methylomirabilis oxygeniifera]|uniref:Uncharacterized protein n=1 Tax=Methylomirabilis oxygeniifera TaxID=671143 RepID=D5MMS9_METO1|nr:MAG: hypothetical protein F9K13_04675 [Candidatus Methylomirabilis oxyfera]CBE68029.1 protein of unknown function [Candidatus Methylomirabilis oxyfera]